MIILILMIIFYIVYHSDLGDVLLLNWHEIVENGDDLNLLFLGENDSSSLRLEVSWRMMMRMV